MSPLRASITISAGWAPPAEAQPLPWNQALSGGWPPGFEVSLLTSNSCRLEVPWKPCHVSSAVSWCSPA